MTHDLSAPALDPTPAFQAPTVPLDAASRDALAASGLTYRAVDVAGEDYIRFCDAVDRGFLGGRPTPEQIEGARDGMAACRPVGVYDAGSPDPDVPVATLNAWVDDMTIDVGRTLPLWAISAVTVSATHRRRGIARALLEGELRAAAGAGVPIAGLTVSETTIYGRYGFGPAVTETAWSIDARRAGWVGPRPTEGEGAGRIDPISRETARDDAAALHEVTRLRGAGEVVGWPTVWRAIVGLAPGQEVAARVRAVRYTDAAGAVRGVLVYLIEAHPEDFTKGTLKVRALVADGDDAYAALWRFALTHDLIGTVRAENLTRSEPLRWLLADPRAATVTEVDHHWLRILDVPACLGARTYRLAGSITLRVSDPLGFAAGSWTLAVDDDGAATVVAAADGGGSEAVAPGFVALGVAELSAMLLGDVRATTLRAAGRLTCTPEDAAWLDVAFGSSAPPRLSLGY